MRHRDPFDLWFRRLPHEGQLVVGVPILVACFWSIWGQWTYVPQPGEPAQALLLTLLLLVVGLILSEYTRAKPKLENARPSGLGDFQFPTTTEGRPVPLIWGRVRQKGANVVWYGDLFQEAIRESVKTGLWSKTKVTKGFRYHLGVQFAICRGPNVVLRRVWVGENEVFDGAITTNTFFDINEPELFGGEDLGSGGLGATCDFYIGNLDQPVNAYLDTTARQRIGSAITPTAPRYTGTCHLVARQLSSAAPVASIGGAYLGNTTSIDAWSFEVERYQDLFTGQSAGENIIGGVDANPINVIFEILTNTEWGFGFPETDVDTGIGSSFLAAADTMITEANGFSLLLDSETPAKEMLLELQRQIEGVVYLKPSTGKWVVKLARDDYDIDLVPQATDSNIAEARDYTRGTWEDTMNTVRVEYDKRDDNYKLSYALAQDMANAMLQGGGTIATADTVGNTLKFPGVKSSALAANIAWRELRGQSYPLSRVVLVSTREFWDVNIGDVIAWTNSTLGLTKLPMRVTDIDFGRLQDNKMSITVVEDVFQFAAASMGAPPPTAWLPPTTGLSAYPSAQILAIESPRAILVRNPDFAGDATISKVFCAARAQGGEVIFRINQRNAVGTPAGTFAVAGDVVSFSLIGQLDAALNAGDGSAIPDAVITINSTPDSQTGLETAFADSTTLSDMGSDLVQLIMIGNEFMLVQSASVNGPDVDLENVYRGALDSAQENHAINANVFLLFLGAGLTDTNFPTTNNVEIVLRMRSINQTFEGAVTPIALTMANRAVRPYSPAALLYNASATVYGTPDLEGDGSGLDGFGYDLDWRRRRFNTSDEISALLTDDTDVDATTEYRTRVFVDPAGANDEVHTTAWATGSGLSAILTRLEIINAAAAGTTVRTQIETRHDIGAFTDLVSTHNLIHDTVPTTTLSGQFYLNGDLRALVISASYTAVATGTFTVNIGSTFNSQIQFRLNGGSFTNLTGYTPGASTSGTIPGVSSSDTIEIQHLTNPGSPSLTFLELQNPSSVAVAYGVLSN